MKSPEFLLSLLFLLSAPPVLAQVDPDPEITKYPVQRIERKAVTNLSAEPTDWSPYMRTIIPSHDDAPQYEDLKSPATLAHKLPGNYVNLKKATFQPKVISGFDATVNNDFFPNDDDMAISNNGKIVAVQNSRISVFDENGNLITERSLAQMALPLGLSGNKFDPRVLYDPNMDRFIVTYLNAWNPQESHLIIAFSQSNDPAEDWNLYSFVGNIKFKGDDNYLDYLNIGITTEELFISANISKGGNYGNAIYQIGLDEGYSGDSLQVQLFTSSYTSFVPVKYGGYPLGPGMYFLRVKPIDSWPTQQVYLHYLDNTIANGGQISKPYVLNADEAFRQPPYADQFNSLQKLETNDRKITAAFIKNEYIYFTLNSSMENKPTIYFGTIKLFRFDLQFSELTAMHIYNKDYELAFANIAFGGCVNKEGRSSVMVVSNFSSGSKYPGFVAHYIDTNGAVSDPVVLKAGEKEFASLYNPTRWGDYTGIAMRCNNPGEVWAVGSFSSNIGEENSWISEIETEKCELPLSIKEKDTSVQVRVYPQPFYDMLTLEFNVPKTGIYEALLYDVSGKMIRTLIKDRLETGMAKLGFNLSPLKPGTYIIRITGGIGEITNHKIVKK